MASFRYVRQVAAPPEVVFDVLTDHRRYTEITPLRKAELEREGEPSPNGLGAIRVLSAVPGPPMRKSARQARDAPAPAAVPRTAATTGRLSAPSRAAIGL